MFNISTSKVVRVIALTREYGPDNRMLYNYIADLNDDEKVNLVALMWVGRETYDAEEFDEAKQVAREEASAPTEQYLSGIPGLAEYLEAGLEAMGVDVTQVEDDL